MDTRNLQTFVTVVQQGSFAAAARQLALAPSAVTRQVAALELELGARLLQRTTRHLSLTAAGTDYYERVCTLLEELERAGEAVRDSTGEATGLVRITASVAYGQTVLVPLLSALHAAHPALQVELLLSDATLDLVAERIDIAVRLGPAVDSSLIGMRLAPVRSRVCASPAYLQRHGRPHALADLSQRDCLRFPLPGFRSEWRLRARDGSEQSVPVRGWLIVSTALAMHRAALDGLGPALLSDWLIGPDLAAGRLVDLFPDHEVTGTDFSSAVWLLYASRAYLPRKLRACVDFLKERLGTP